MVSLKRISPWHIIALIFVLIGTSRIYARSVPDSVVALKYSLDKGRTYQWNLVADQFIVNGRSLRVSAKYMMDAIDSDKKGNTQVRIRVRTSSVDARAGEIIDSVKGGLFPVGSRRTNKAGVYDAMVDQLGKILTGQFSLDENTPPPVITDQSLTNQFESSRGVDIPAMMNMMMPSMPGDSQIEVHQTKYDTLYVQSSSQSIAGQRGSVGDANDVRAKMDTIYRTISLDSIQVRTSGRRVCHMTVRAIKKTTNGGSNLIETTVIRDTESGLMELVIERGFYHDADGTPKPQYVAVAVIETDLTVITNADGDEVLTPPSMSPSPVR